MIVTLKTSSKSFSLWSGRRFLFVCFWVFFCLFHFHEDKMGEEKTNKKQQQAGRLFVGQTEEGKRERERKRFARSSDELKKADKYNT